MTAFSSLSTRPTAADTRRVMRNPAAFVGKQVNPLRWVIDERYQICEYTGKLFDTEAGSPSFPHTAFNYDFLREIGCYVEDAAWLSPEGYDLMIAKLDGYGITLDMIWDAYADPEAMGIGWEDVSHRDSVEVPAAPNVYGEEVKHLISVETIEAAIYDLIDLGVTNREAIYNAIPARSIAVWGAFSNLEGAGLIAVVAPETYAHVKPSDPEPVDTSETTLLDFERRLRVALSMGREYTPNLIAHALKTKRSAAFDAKVAALRDRGVLSSAFRFSAKIEWFRLTGTTLAS